jgi:hypothetical protein
MNVPAFEWTPERADRVFRAAVRGHEARRRRHRRVRVATMAFALCTFAFGALRAAAGPEDESRADYAPVIDPSADLGAGAQATRGPRIDDAGYGRD